MEGNDNFDGDNIPQKKKKKSGKISPRHLFGSLTEETVKKMAGSQSKKYTFSKNIWKPPLKVNYSFKEQNIIGSGANKDKDNNHIHIQSSQTSSQTSFGDQKENYFSSDNKQALLNDSKPFNSYALVDNTNLNTSRTNEDSFDTSSYIDYSVEKELSESMKKDFETAHTISPIENLDKSQEVMEITDGPISAKCDDKESIGSQDSFPDTYKNSAQNLEGCNALENCESIHSSPFITLPNKSPLPETFQKNIEPETELSSNPVNSMKVIDLNDDKLDLCDDNQYKYSNEHVPKIHSISVCSKNENEYTLHDSDPKEDINQGSSQNENSLNNTFINKDGKGTKELIPENIKTQMQENEFPSSGNNFGNTDPFHATVSNSQFLRLENEIYSSGKDLLKSSSELSERKLEAAKKNVLSLGNQIECQKTIHILRRMINDVEELNKSVVKATMQLRNQYKGLP